LSPHDSRRLAVWTTTNASTATRMTLVTSIDNGKAFGTITINNIANIHQTLLEVSRHNLEKVSCQAQNRDQWTEMTTEEEWESREGPKLVLHQVWGVNLEEDLDGRNC
jgi:hypothetical protein